MEHLLAVITFALLGNAYSQCPSIPLNLPGQPVSVQDTEGLWYEYRYRNGPVGSDGSGNNVRINQTIQGAFPNSRQASYVVTRYYNYLSPSNTDPNKWNECDCIYQVGNWTADGKRYTLSYMGNPIENLTYTNLFTDYKLLQILYRCQTPNADGKRCDEPYMWINTRVQPPLLTASQKSYIEAASNYYLKQVCRGFADTSATEWDMSQITPCNAALGQPPMPPVFAAEMAKLKLTV